MLEAPERFNIKIYNKTPKSITITSGRVRIEPELWLRRSIKLRPLSEPISETNDITQYI